MLKKFESGNKVNLKYKYQSVNGREYIITLSDYVTFCKRICQLAKEGYLVFTSGLFEDDFTAFQIA
jgi:hypothetical protein